MKIQLVLILTSMIYVNTYAQVNSQEQTIDENVPSLNYVYPIPTKGILNIHSNYAILKIEIFDMIGDLVYSKPMATGLKERKIDISHLKAGIYFLKIVDEKENIDLIKIVKE